MYPLTIKLVVLPRLSVYWVENIGKKGTIYLKIIDICQNSFL